MYKDGIIQNTISVGVEQSKDKFCYNTEINFVCVPGHLTSAPLRTVVTGVYGTPTCYVDAGVQTLVLMIT